ncbi:MAG: hypothetical protein H0T47_02930 [Planctomycetaceae bacterium]|nr:hypothetical protein [Planctomycetaceae bacterium]
MDQTNLLRHDGVIFEDQVVFAAGHAYVNCEFRNCTVVIGHSKGGIFQNCSFGPTVWRLEVTMSDQNDLAALVGMMEGLMRGTLLPGIGPPPTFSSEGGKVSMSLPEEEPAKSQEPKKAKPKKQSDS